MKKLMLLLVLGCVSFGPEASADKPDKPAPPVAAKPAGEELTLTGTLGCGKCSFHEAKACQNVLKVKVPGQKKDDTYVLADNETSRANHEKVCGPASPATVTGTISKTHGKKVLTATAIKFD